MDGAQGRPYLPAHSHLQEEELQVGTGVDAVAPLSFAGTGSGGI